MRFETYDRSLALIRALRPILPRVTKHDRKLAGHMRDAANSVALNLREGSRRLGKDRIYHYSVAAGSADEVQGSLLQSEAWGYLSLEELTEALDLADRVLAMTYRLTHPRAP